MNPITILLHSSTRTEWIPEWYDEKIGLLQVFIHMDEWSMDGYSRLCPRARVCQIPPARGAVETLMTHFAFSQSPCLDAIVFRSLARSLAPTGRIGSRLALPCTPSPLAMYHLLLSGQHFLRDSSSLRALRHAFLHCRLPYWSGSSRACWRSIISLVSLSVWKCLLSVLEPGGLIEVVLRACACVSLALEFVHFCGFRMLFGWKLSACVCVWSVRGLAGGGVIRWGGDLIGELEAWSVCREVLFGSSRRAWERWLGSRVEWICCVVSGYKGWWGKI